MVFACITGYICCAMQACITPMNCKNLHISDRDPTPNITRNVSWGSFNHYNFTYLEINWHSYIWFRYRQSHYGFWNEYFPRMASQNYCKNN